MKTHHSIHPPPPPELRGDGFSDFGKLQNRDYIFKGVAAFPELLFLKLKKMKK